MWAEGVATAEDIELGVKSTIGFRMPFYGPFGHYDLSGAWRWPDDPAANRSPLPEPSAEVRARIQARMAERRPWFHDPDRIGEAALVRDRVLRPPPQGALRRPPLRPAGRNCLTHSLHT